MALVDITDYETAALKQCGCDLDDGQSHKVAFIGSGPLPLSAFLLAREYPNLEVTMIDREAEAHELAMRWMKLIDPEASQRIHVLLQDFSACTPSAFKDFDVVYLGVSAPSLLSNKTDAYYRQALAAMNNGKPTFQPRSFLSYAKTPGWRSERWKALVVYSIILSLFDFCMRPVSRMRKLSLLRLASSTMCTWVKSKGVAVVLPE